MEKDNEAKIMELADKKALEFLEMDPTKEFFKSENFEAIQKQATFGYRMKREYSLNRRAEIDQKLRAVRMAINDPEMRERYIRESSPKLLPTLKRKP